MTETVTSKDTSSVPEKEGFSNTFLGVFLLLCGLVGFGASALLLYERIQLWTNSSYVTACDINPWVSCGAVMESWQASTFGFPNIILGIIGFPVLIFSSLALLFFKDTLTKNSHKLWWTGMQAGMTFAFAFVVWLWYSAVFSIGVLCPYCMIVWAAVIPAFIALTARNIVHNSILGINFPDGFKNFMKQWWWVIIVILYLLTIVSIILMFPYAFNIA